MHAVTRGGTVVAMSKSIEHMHAKDPEGRQAGIRPAGGQAVGMGSRYPSLRRAVSDPRERTRALLETRRFLEELCIADVPPSMRLRAQGCLRHYPTVEALSVLARHSPDWLAPTQAVTAELRIEAARSAEGRADVRTLNLAVPQGLGKVTSMEDVVGGGRLAHLDWIHDALVANTNLFAFVFGSTPEELVALEAGGDLFSLAIEGDVWWPAELLNLHPWDGLEICRALGDADGSSKLEFLVRKHEALGGRTVTEAVERGQFDDVLRLAQDWGTR